MTIRRKDPKLDSRSAPGDVRSAAEVKQSDGSEPPAGMASHAPDGFYRAFEKRFRGPRSLILQRLRIYLPFVAPLLELHQQASAVDLGCGRGEWLELLAEQGFITQGVDQDAGMLQAALELGLDVIQGDAVAHLQSLDDETLSVVSGFHIAEHLAFPELQLLVAESLRVLKPGGLLILETPNPENIVVGASNFYTDPTHQRPLPPALLVFLPEYHGFERCKIVRMQEDADMAFRPDVSLLDVLSGVSPDFAVVAQKAASDEVLAQFALAFEGNYGLALHEVAQRYEHAITARIAAAEVSAERARVEYFEPQLARIRSEIDALHELERARVAYFEPQLAQARSEIDALHERLNVVIGEAAAERARVDQLQLLLARATMSLPRRIARALGAPIVVAMIRIVVKRPELLRKLNASLQRHPRTLAHIRQFAIARGLIEQGSGAVGPATKHSAMDADDEELARLTPHARKIYLQLLKAIEERRVG